MACPQDLGRPIEERLIKRTIQGDLFLKLSNKVRRYGSGNGRLSRRPTPKIYPCGYKHLLIRIGNRLQSLIVSLQSFAKYWIAEESFQRGGGQRAFERRSIFSFENRNPLFSCRHSSGFFQMFISYQVRKSPGDLTFHPTELDVCVSEFTRLFLVEMPRDSKETLDTGLPGQEGKKYKIVKRGSFGIPLSDFDPVVLIVSVLAQNQLLELLLLGILLPHPGKPWYLHHVGRLNRNRLITFQASGKQKNCANKNQFDYAATKTDHSSTGHGNSPHLMGVLVSRRRERIVFVNIRACERRKLVAGNPQSGMKASRGGES
ncbi:MAG: hypothetical protein KIT40_09430 [Nitrospira sp.]|nr:hypothetical protein [Nitrospira sp.]